MKYTVNKKRQERQKTNNLKSEEEKKKLDNIKTEVQVEDTYIEIANYYIGITCKWMLVVPDT